MASTPSFRIFRTWIWEILSVSTAIGLIAAIATLLVSYDGKPAPDWGARLSLNALLALLSTILRAMLVVVVSQIICQQKWEWYGNRHARPLSDFQQFDSGSRGSLGALLLIPTVALKDAVAFIAAVVLVVSFLVGPFVQQASRSKPCTFTVPDQNASLPYAHYVPRRGGFAPFTGGNDGTPSSDIIVAIMSSVTAPDGKENQISASCSTGNCTFHDEDLEQANPQYVADNSSSLHSTMGICHACTDITSLVQTNKTKTGTQYTLPNQFNITYGSNSLLAKIGTTSDLSWMGDMFTPELRSMSRWSYVNTTFLAGNRKTTAAVAAACVLYPCLRTFTASITNNQLLETEVSSETMQVDVTKADRQGGIDYMKVLTARQNHYYPYATVKFPCQVDGKTYNSVQDLSSLPNTTKINLFDFTNYRDDDGSHSAYQNISAPEHCIYRQHAEFVKAISEVFHAEVFDGECSGYKGPNCRKADERGAGYLTNLGVSTVLNKMIEGEVAYSNVTSWFNSFANVMTNRFRSEYGAATYNATDRNLPLGEVQGIVWRTQTCVSAHRDWLALPICLTAITTLLMLWTIGANWRHRRSRPVWKDSLLPLIFYGHRIESKDSDALPHPLRQTNEDSDDTGAEESNKLLEASQMNKISSKTLVTFQWPEYQGLENESDGTPTFALQHRKGWLRHRKTEERDVDSLLETTDVQDNSVSDVEHR